MRNHKGVRITYSNQRWETVEDHDRYLSVFRIFLLEIIAKFSFSYYLKFFYFGYYYRVLALKCMEDCNGSFVSKY